MVIEMLDELKCKLVLALVKLMGFVGLIERKGQ